jgi:hypothetical protein
MPPLTQRPARQQVFCVLFTHHILYIRAEASHASAHRSASADARSCVRPMPSYPYRDGRMVLPSGLSLTGKICVCTLASVPQGLVAPALPHACMELDADDPRQSSPSLAMFLPPVPPWTIPFLGTAATPHPLISPPSREGHPAGSLVPIHRDVYHSPHPR